MAERKRKFLGFGGDDDHPAMAGAGFGAPDSVGTTLAIARERLGYDLHDVAHALRIRYVYLEAIEAGRYADLPGDAYVSGFLRTYGAFLGLDGNALVSRYREEVSGGLRRPELNFPKPVAEGRMPGGVITLIGVLIAAVAYGAWYYTTSTDRSLVDMIQPLPGKLKALVEGSPSGQSATVAVPPPAKTASGDARQAAGSLPVPVQPSAANPAAAPPVPALAVPPANSAANPAANPTSPTSLNQPPAAPPGPATAAGTAPPGAASPLVASPGGTVPVASLPPAPGGVIPPAEVSPAPAVGSAGTAPPPPPSAAAAPGAVAPPPPPAAASTPVPSPGAAAAATGSAASAPGAAASAPPPAGGAASAPASGQVFGATTGPSHIEIRATQDSWIQVRDANGQLLLTRVLHPGDVYRVPDQPGLKMVTGNAGGLAITVDGAAAPSLGATGKVLHDVPLDAQRLMAGTAAQ